MPTYVFKCNVCGEEKVTFARISQLDKLKESMSHCGERMPTVIQGGSNLFERSPFPKEAFDHADYNPKVFRDKYHLLDHCEEVGIRSRLLEDGDVP